MDVIFGEQLNIDCAELFNKIREYLTNHGMTGAETTEYSVSTNCFGDLFITEKKGRNSK